MILPSKVRLGVACFGLCSFFVGAGFRLYQLQVLQHEHFAAIAAEKHGIKQSIHARRGTIYDAAGEVLAQNEPLKTVVADASLIPENRVEELCGVLSRTLGCDATDLAAKIATGRKYIVVKRRVTEEDAAALMQSLHASGLKGVHLEQDARRIYPNGSMLCHVVGFLNHEGAGIQGIEMTMDERLRGSDGFRYSERDRFGREIVAHRRYERTAKDGHDVRLTVDMALQAIVENELDIAVKQYNPVAATVVMLEPNSGDILALANRPHFDPNAVADAPDAAMKNRAIIDMVEPGSTFKIVTTAAALEERTTSLDQPIFCHNGSFAYGGRTLRDAHPYGTLSTEMVLVKSSNIGSAKLAMDLGDRRLYEYIRKFGFGERTGVLLPGEINGTVHPPHRWSKISITRVPMGHEVAVTPLQIAAAMAVIANGGRLMMPQIVKEITDAEGNVVRRFHPVEVRRVVSEETAHSVRKCLARVVSNDGTARLAKIPGFTAAGKTGTAQKVDPKGGYTPGKYVVSFVGFMPANNPRFVCLVMLDDARTGNVPNYGGTIAAPIFRQISERAARYLNIEPDELDEPSVGALTKSEPRKSTKRVR